MIERRLWYALLSKRLQACHLPYPSAVPHRLERDALHHRLAALEAYPPRTLQEQRLYATLLAETLLEAAQLADEALVDLICCANLFETAQR